MLTLTFDVGKTACRAALFEDERRIAEAEQPGSSGLADPAGVDAALRSMEAAAAQAGFARADVVCAGLAGFARARDRAHELGVELARRFGTDSVTLASDITIAHAGAMGGAAGVVVVAGTGAVALAIDEAGRAAICDGWGYLLGDEGSGYAIGRAGLASALREYDGRGGSAVLRRIAEQRFGALESLPATVHGAPNPPRTIAGFARDVAAAAREGDETALEIWRAAGRALAATAAAAGRGIFGANRPFDVAAIGGLFRAGALLAETFEAELQRCAPPARLQTARGDALEGARLLAARPELPHASLALRPLRTRARESP